MNTLTLIFTLLGASFSLYASSIAHPNIPKYQYSLREIRIIFNNFNINMKKLVKLIIQNEEMEKEEKFIVITPPILAQMKILENTKKR